MLDLIVRKQLLKFVSDGMGCKGFNFLKYYKCKFTNLTLSLKIIKKIK